MELLTRLRTTPLDLGLTLGLVLVAVVQVQLFPIAAAGMGELFVVGTTLPLAWWRTFPVEAALVASSFWLIPVDGYFLLGFVVVILQFFAVGARGEPRLAVVLVTAWACVTSVVSTLLGPEDPVVAIGAVLVVVAPVLAGRLVRRQQRQNQALAALAEALRAERSRAEEAAVGAERARIAQELHDVVGHEVTLIAIQAEAAAAALTVTPERAVEPVEAIRVTAHRIMTEIRAVLDVLTPTDGTERPASEGLSALVERARAAGIECSLSVTGVPQPDQSPVSLAVHRIVQECLTNAGRHAPAEPVSLAVDWTPAQVNVRATNPAGSRGRPKDGRGLAGIRHRAELLGGAFALDSGDGLFDVRVRIPTTAGEPS